MSIRTRSCSPSCRPASQELQAIVTKYAQAEPDDLALLTEETVRRVAASEAQQRAEIAALLSAQELENLDLRKSATAERLRQELRGFQSTEAEFRQLFRVRRAYEPLGDQSDVRDPNVLQVRIEAERRFGEEARATLGDESLLGGEVLKEYRRNNRWWIWSD